MAWTSESDLETWMLARLDGLGYACGHGADISPEMRDPERRNFHDAILRKVFAASVRRLNPDLPDGAVNEVMAQVSDEVFAGDLISENRRLHGLMVRGVPVTYHLRGEERHDRARLIDWSDEANTWQAFNQVDMVGRSARIPDLVVYLNGLPLVVVELKGVEGADIEAAFNQIETYKGDIPNLFRTTVFSVISDGLNARYGTLSAGLDRFMRWRTIDGETIVPETKGLAQETLTKGY